MFHTMKNLEIDPPLGGILLAEALLTARRQANALDGPYAYFDGTYGAIDNALVQCLVDCLLETSLLNDETAATEYEIRKLAKRLVEEATDNGENITYQIGLWNASVIDLPDEPCDCC